MFTRTRITLQIVMTLVSFLGFNEAVLAVRYRNNLYLSNFGAPMANLEQKADFLLTTGYKQRINESY